MLIEKLNYNGEAKYEPLVELEYYEQIATVGTASTLITLPYVTSLTMETYGTEAISYRMNQNPDFAGVKQVAQVEILTQVESAGTLTMSMVGGLLGTNVEVICAVLTTDTVEGIATKLVTAFNLDATVGSHYTASVGTTSGGDASLLVITADVEAANDTTMEITVYGETEMEFTEVVSTITTAGQAPGDDYWFTILSTDTIEIKPPVGAVASPMRSMWAKADEATYLVIYGWGRPGQTVSIDV